MIDSVRTKNLVELLLISSRMLDGLYAVHLFI